MLAKEDPATSWESLDPKRHRWDADLIAALVLEDPAIAFELADHRTRLQPIIESWAWKDFAAAEKAAIEAKRPRQREAVIGLARMKAT